MFVKNLYKKFDTAKKQKIISNYRVSVSESKSFCSGIINKEIAGVYNPNNFSSQISGNCLIEWQDHLISSGSFNNEILYHFDEFLKDIKLLRYKDPDGANFLGAQKYPEVQLYDKKVADIVDGKEKKLLEIMLKLDKWQNKMKTKLKEIDVFASVSKNTIFTSKGLFSEEKTTSCGYCSCYEEKIILEDHLRKIPDQEKMNKKRNFIENFYSYLTGCKKIKPKNQKLQVFLMPWISKEIFLHFIASNLAGSAVYNKQSCFSLNDFKNKKQVLNTDLSFNCNPTIDFDIGSYKFTSEGVPTQKTDFIKNGRLENQILDLKYAKLQKKQATAILSKPLLKSEKQVLFEESLKSINQGIIIFNILGLHTQSPVSGDYSLPSPQALYIRKGRIIGRVRVIITGNIFEDMMQENFQIINFAAEEFPGFLMKTNVSFELVR